MRQIGVPLWVGAEQPCAFAAEKPERAIARVQAGESVRSVAAALSISPSSVVKWSQRFRATGGYAPRRTGDYRPRAIAGAQAGAAISLAVGDGGLGDALPDQEGLDPVDRRRPPRDQAGANAMRDLQIELVLGLLLHQL